MTTLLELWKSQNDFLQDKSFSQLINIAGEGQLRDDNNTSAQIRELLNIVPTSKLKEYGSQCLFESFKDSGFALQDVVNQLGKRLGFYIEEGLYRGKRNDVGFDGLWTIKNEHSFIIEVKTTDAYRINLNTINAYKEKLIQQGKIDNDNSSILIIVGRQDTGDLEAQIRGSKFAWNIRLVSIEALMKLIDLRENVSDTQTLKQINQILKPLEYTRLDKLIDLLYLTSEDDDDDIEDEKSDDKPLRKEASNREAPVSFNESCITLISSFFDKIFIKQSKATYESNDKEIGLSCAVSKLYVTKHSDLYWYAFHPHQYEFLKDYTKSFVSFGCGNPEQIILIPLSKFMELTQNMNQTTKSNGKSYWHVKIHKISDEYEIEQPLSPNKDRKNISKFSIKKST